MGGNAAKRRILQVAVCAALALVLPACDDKAKLSEQATTGPKPTLPSPNHGLLPTVSVAHATGWPPGVKPTPAAGLSVDSYGSGLDHPRWLYVLPNGDVLVAESDGPPRPEDGRGPKGWIYRTIQKWAGSGTPSANRVVLLRGVKPDGGAELRADFLQGLNSPFGMALVGHDLYVANTDAVLRFPYAGGETKVIAPGVKVADLPAGPINHHWTKNLIASPDGSRLYATVGSNSNAGENGVDKEAGRAGILEIDLATGQSRTFASGMRNPNGMVWQPQTGALWTVVNERDELSSDLVPDYLTSVKGGAFYGFPFSYYGQHVDARVSPQRPDLVARAVVPDYALGNHVAPLGLAYSDGALLTAHPGSGVFIGEHGSWNRRPKSGYKVVFVPFADGQPAGQPIDVLTGFLSADDRAFGRPVGVAMDRSGALLVADDVGNTVWRVTSSAQHTATAR